MKLFFSRTFPWMVSVILVVLTSWLIVRSSRVTFVPAATNTPDAFMTRVDAVKYDKNGQPRYFFKAGRMEIFASTQITEMVHPFYIFRHENESPWHVHADHGTAQHGTDVILLTGSVKIQQLPGANSRQIILTTDKMILYPNRSLAETERPVTIQRPGSIVHSVGMQADLKTGEIRLLSKTKGEYSS